MVELLLDEDGSQIVGDVCYRRYNTALTLSLLSRRLFDYSATTFHHFVVTLSAAWKFR